MIQKFTMKLFSLFRVHQIRTEVHTFKQMDLETYTKVWERFKNSFRKYPKLDIPKQAHVYYYGLHPELCNIIDASVGGSVAKIEIDDAFDLYESIPKKATGMHKLKQ